MKTNLVKLALTLALINLSVPAWASDPGGGTEGGSDDSGDSHIIIGNAIGDCGDSALTAGGIMLAGAVGSLGKVPPQGSATAGGVGIGLGAIGLLKKGLGTIVIVAGEVGGPEGGGGTGGESGGTSGGTDGTGTGDAPTGTGNGAGPTRCTVPGRFAIGPLPIQTGAPFRNALGGENPMADMAIADLDLTVEALNRYLAAHASLVNTLDSCERPTAEQQMEYRMAKSDFAHGVADFHDTLRAIDRDMQVHFTAHPEAAATAIATDLDGISNRIDSVVALIEPDAAGQPRFTALQLATALEDKAEAAGDMTVQQAWDMTIQSELRNDHTGFWAELLTRSLQGDAR